MGVIEGRSRSATARAVTDGEAEVLTARQFLERVSSDPALARDLILRLSMRLRRIEDKITGNLLLFAHDRSSDGAGETASDAVIADDATIGSPLRAMRCARGSARRLSCRQIAIPGWPVPVEGDARPLRRPDLLIEDEEPFRLSRQHFMIARSGERLLVSDSEHARTMVNGWAIGHHFMKDAEPLHRGENHVVAGGKNSPFQIFGIYPVRRRHLQVIAALRREFSCAFLIDIDLRRARELFRASRCPCTLSAPPLFRPRDVAFQLCAGK